MAAAAAYPDATRAFVARQDQIDFNNAADINDLQTEVVAIQKTLGRNPHITNRLPSTSVSTRLDLLEDNLFPRVVALEQRMRRAAISARRGSPILVNSGAGWQVHVYSEVVTELNDFTGTTLYNNSTGRMYSVAPSPGIWSVTASVTFVAQITPVGLRALALVTSGGKQLAVVRQMAYGVVDQVLTVNWTGRLPDDPTYFLETRVQQSQGEAVYIQADASETPTRIDFTHIPG